MTSERDIYATALLLIRQHGIEGATYHACARADEMHEAGDLDGMAAWQRILKAIDAISAAPGPDDVKH